MPNPIDEAKLNAIITQIDASKRSVRFDMRELTIELYVDKYQKGLDADKNELYVPDYQREFVWDIRHQSRFIESLILGLPVPFIFAAEMEDSGRLEIVDGSQRIRTMAAYINDEFQLKNLEKLTELNGTYFSQLPMSRQRMFKNTPIRMIVLSVNATEDVRKEMFDRINTSSVALLPMETRRGIYRGEFTNFIIELAKNERFKALLPLPKYLQNRREEEELLLRFFAFVDCYPNYRQVESNSVAVYLNEYLQKKNENFSEDEKNDKMRAFNMLVDFISMVYPHQGFAKKANTIGVSRAYFEAIAVGAYLALKEKPTMPRKVPEDLKVDKKHRNKFLESIDGRYTTHTATKIKSRIDIVKNAFLNNA